MSKLSPMQIDIFNLIRRSKPQEDGRYKVSSVVLPLVQNADIPVGLLEITPTEDGGYAKVTEQGRLIMDYLI